MLELLRLTVRRARQERLPQLAGSLTFTTVLSVVPLTVVCFALFTRVPALAALERAIEEQLLRGLLPPELARTVLASLHRFAANGTGLNALGLLFTALSAVALLVTVENALNQIWQVRRARPLPRRLGLHALILLLGPPLVGASLWATSTLLRASAGWVGALPPSAVFGLNLGPLLLGALGLTALYRWVPNTAVRLPDALTGGVLAALSLELGKRGFAAWVLKIPTYQAVYGALAALPLFLLWVYFSWLVTLAAALVAANLPRCGARAGSRRTPRNRTAA